jgi:AcrR family transcriptional regulator
VATQRLPGQRAGLSRDDVLSAARALLDEGGLDALSMRAVARRLGVAPNALYSHVAGKTELLDAVLDETLAAIDEPPPGAAAAEPAAAVLALMCSAYEVLAARPALVPLYVMRQGARGERSARFGEVLDGLLERLGLPAARIPEVRRVLIVHTIGFASLAAQSPDDPGERPVSADELARSLVHGLEWLLAGAVGSTTDAAVPDRARRGPGHA